MITIELYDTSIRLRTPLRTARGSHETLDGVVVAVDDGRDRGWGEATPVPGFGVHPAAVVRDQLETLVVDATAAAEDVDELLERVKGRFADVPAARFAAHGAVLDLLARRARRPLAVEVAERAGAVAAGAVRSGALVTGDDVEELVDSATRAVADGFDTVKLKVGHGPLEDDVAAVAAIRTAVGPRVALRLDANGAWDVDGARTAVEVLGPFDIDLLEEPTPGLRDIERVATRVEVPVAADESIGSLEDLRRAAGAAPAVVVKPGRLGDVVSVALAARRVAATGARVVVTTLLDGAIARAGAACVAAALDDTDERHGLSTGRLLEIDITSEPRDLGPTTPTDGGPGLGFEPDI